MDLRINPGHRPSNIINIITRTWRIARTCLGSGCTTLVWPSSLKDLLHNTTVHSQGSSVWSCFAPQPLQCKHISSPRHLLLSSARAKSVAFASHSQQRTLPMVCALENYLPSSVRAERSGNDVTLIENQGFSDTSAQAHSIGIWCTHEWFHALWYGDTIFMQLHDIRIYWMYILSSHIKPHISKLSKETVLQSSQQKQNWAPQSHARTKPGDQEDLGKHSSPAKSRKSEYSEPRILAKQGISFRTTGELLQMQEWWRQLNW